jgi:hypothetical protein
MMHGTQRVFCDCIARRVHAILMCVMIKNFCMLALAAGIQMHMHAVQGAPPGRQRRAMITSESRLKSCSAKV